MSKRVKRYETYGYKSQLANENSVYVHPANERIEKAKKNTEDNKQEITLAEKKLLNKVLTQANHSGQDITIHLSPYIIFSKSAVLKYAKAINYQELEDLKDYLKGKTKSFIRRPDFLILRSGWVIEIDGPIHNGEINTKHDNFRNVIYNSIGLHVHTIISDDIDGARICFHINAILNAPLNESVRKSIQERLSKQPGKHPDRIAKYDYTGRKNKSYDFNYNCSDNRKRLYGVDYKCRIKNGGLVFKSNKSNKKRH